MYSRRADSRYRTDLPTLTNRGPPPSRRRFASQLIEQPRMRAASLGVSRGSIAFALVAALMRAPSFTVATQSADLAASVAYGCVTGSRLVFCGLIHSLLPTLRL